MKRLLIIAYQTMRGVAYVVEWIVTGVGWVAKAIAVVLMLIGGLSGLVAVICLLVFLVVGAWDLMVWLLNSKAKTTDFAAPIIAAVIGLSAWVLSAVCIGIGEVLSGDSSNRRRV